MFYLRGIFLFSLFTFSGFSLAAEDFGEYEYSDLELSDFFEALKDFYLENEAPSFINGNQETLKSSNLYSGVVRLILEDQSGGGTGFFITQEILATAHHVAVKGPLYFRDPLTDDKVSTKVLGFDDKYDLALLKAVNYESEDFYSVGSLEDEAMNDYLMTVKAALSENDSYEVEKGEAVIITGFPHGSFHVMQGIIREMRGSFIYATVTIDKKKYGFAGGFAGMSGSPVFSRDEEKLIGVTAVQEGYGLILFGARRIGFVPVRHLKNLVRRVESRGTLSLELQSKILKNIWSYSKK